MDSNFRFGIIGCLADGHQMYDGQTVSTRVWRDELNKLSSKPVIEVDTFQYKKHVFKIMYQLLYCILKSTHIVIMLSGNGLKVFLPIMYFASRYLGKKIYHRVIGGELDSFIDRNKGYSKYLNYLKVNWVQSPVLAKNLETRGVTNAIFLENFRNISSIEKKNVICPTEKPFSFCTFCRVSIAKGIKEAISAVVEINDLFGPGTATLDIYGPVEQDFKDEFFTLIEGKDFVRYKGSVESSQAVPVLKDYFMHLFPTTWSGEGFPGALIDCYNAALPTLATDWAYNAEYISDGSTGYLYHWNEPQLLLEKMKYAISHPEEVNAMRYKCLEESKKYNADVIMKKVAQQMGINKEQ